MKKGQLVLVKTTFIDETGSDKYRIGTGYFIAPNLVLTSNHVFPPFQCESVKIRVEEGGKWMDAGNQPHWQSESLDAALIKTNTEIIIESPIQWQDKPPEEGEPLSWKSDGYPEAGKGVNEQGNEYYTTKGLEGIWHPFGGAGQEKIPSLDLQVSDKPSDPAKWSGISGAPVFVKNKLIGILRSFQPDFPNRLKGIPSYELFKDARFRAAIEGDKFALPEHENWALIVISENPKEESFTGPVNAALSESLEAGSQVISVSINDILESPGTLLNFIKLICRAPIMIIDATGFQPGIMLVVGIRAVVRRGVTIVATTESIVKIGLNNLPFNIQEIKLVVLHFSSYPEGKILSPKDRLEIAIKEGKAQMEKNPKYLDLPPFDAIRNPVIVDIPAIKEKILFLCPFKADHNVRFNFIRNNVTNFGSKKTEDIVRMLDITSPQLVGQSLYEHIRWSNICIIDWTKWRPNIFYELGVRLAASDIDPINLIEFKETVDLKTSLSKNKAGNKQKQLLIRLFEPYTYDMKKEEFQASVENYFGEIIIKGKDNLKKSESGHSKIFQNHIYYTAEEYFDWKQENINKLPHQNIKRQMEREFGKETQTLGRYNILFSSNKGFKDAIENQKREYWLCAWYYLLNRYLREKEEFKADESKKKELQDLGESVMQALDIESYKSIKAGIAAIIDEL